MASQGLGLIPDRRIPASREAVERVGRGQRFPAAMRSSDDSGNYGDSPRDDGHGDDDDGDDDTTRQRVT